MRKFFFVNLEDVPLGEFVWVVPHSLVHLLGLHTVQFRHRKIGYDILPSEANNLVAHRLVSNNPILHIIYLLHFHNLCRQGFTHILPFSIAKTLSHPLLGNIMRIVNIYNNIVLIIFEPLSYEKVFYKQQNMDIKK